MPYSLDKEPSFYALIIGTEILNRRRHDAHFDFVSKVLAQKGYTLSGSFIIADEPDLIVKTIQYIASLPQAILFSFGGIGSTPDDYTRACASRALRDGRLILHPQAKDIIEAKLGTHAYPHAIKMAELPKGATLLHNPINQMPAFALDARYYFMPGFPQMSHPMVEAILQILIPHKKYIHRYSFTALCKESLFIDIMQDMPQGVEYSSLPKLSKHTWQVTISVASQDQALAQEAFARYISLLQAQNMSYTLEDEA
ncbi:MAG: molybdopterin-binding protein [Sulfurovum sp.]|nr:molybdopterin-binding protein [Sulfurovum sp.]